MYYTCSFCFETLRLSNKGKKYTKFWQIQGLTVAKQVA